MNACASIWPCGRGGCSGLSGAMVSGGARGGGLAHLAAPAQTAQDDATALQLFDVFRAAHSKLDQTPPAALSVAVCAADSARRGAGACAAVARAVGQYAGRSALVFRHAEIVYAAGLRGPRVGPRHSPRDAT